MPNWCQTAIEFAGNKEAIYKLYHFIDDQKYLVYVQEPNHFNKNYWLGTFLERAGLDIEKFRCRGQITYSLQTIINHYTYILQALMIYI